MKPDDFRGCLEGTKLFIDVRDNPDLQRQVYERLLEVGAFSVLGNADDRLSWLANDTRVGFVGVTNGRYSGYMDYERGYDWYARWGFVESTLSDLYPSVHAQVDIEIDGDVFSVPRRCISEIMQIIEHNS